MRIPDSVAEITSGTVLRCPTRWLALVVVLLAAVCSLRADIFHTPEEWRWLRFSTESGLPSVEINSLCETPSGTAWVGTAAGPAWYNGFFWQRIDSTFGIPAAGVSTIFPLGRDSVVTLIQGELYAGNTRGFRPLLRTLYSRGPVLSAVPYGSDSVVFLASENGKPSVLYLYSRNTLVQLSMPGALSTTFIISERPNYGLFYTRNNHIWLNTETGLYRLEGNNWRLVYQHRTSYSPVSAVVEDSNGGGFFFLAMGPQQGFWRFEHNGNPTYTHQGSSASLMSADVSPDGGTAAVYSNGIISYYNGSSWHTLASEEQEIIGTKFIRYRSNGDLWLQSANVLMLFRSSLRRWQHYGYGYENGRDHINDQLTTRNGALWMATGHGVHLYQPGQPLQSFISIKKQELTGITALGEDTEGGIWIGSGGTFSGTYRWDGKSWKHFDISSGAPRVHKIRRDHRGRLWFLTMSPTLGTSGYGAFVYENGKFTRWGKERGLLDERVYSFTEGRDGALWFGTLLGISRWHNGSWKYWKFTDDLEDRAYALAADSSGRVWYSRYRHGFGYIQNDSMHSVPIPTTDGSPAGNPVAVDIQVDRLNRLWIATQGNGLYCYNKGVFSNIGLTMGLSSSNLWPLLPVDNRLYIGTIGRGLDILSLDEDKTPLPVALFNRTTVEKTTAAISWRPYSYWGQIPSNNIETRYSIDGGPWSDWSTEHEAFLHDLSSGTHTVSVQTKGMFAEVSNQLYTTSFEIPAPFYATPWFVIPLGFLLFATMGLAGDAIARRRRYTNDLKRVNVELEERIRERTAALVTANEHLRSEVNHRQQAEEELRLALSKEKELGELKTRFVTMVSHEFRTPLSAILASTDVLDRYYDRLTGEEKEKYYNRIRDSVARITTLMEDVLFIGNAGSGKLTFIPMMLNIDTYCRDIIAALPQNQAERIRYSFEGATPEATLDSKLLRLILLNILSNAFAYSKAPSAVEMRVSSTPDSIAIAIADQGIGIPREDIDKIFDAFHRGTNIGTIPGSGLGLSIVRECIDLHRGTITVHSLPNEGTEVRIVLPMARRYVEVQASQKN